MNTIYLSVLAGSELVNDNYLGVQMIYGADNFRIVSSGNAAGVDGPAPSRSTIGMNSFLLTMETPRNCRSTGKTPVSASQPAGIYGISTIVDGAVQSDGSIENGICVQRPGTWMISFAYLPH